MKSLKGFMSKQMIIPIIGLMAISIVIWFGAEFIRFGEEAYELSYGGRFSAIAALVLIYLLIIGFRYGFKQHKQNQLYRQMSAPKPSELGMTELADKEVFELGVRFKEAIKALKGLDGGRAFRKRGLYELPWYVVLGAPGSGKTTALKNSGLNFPLANSAGREAIGGIGGTRNCDWWFTDDAVFLDTAGRYTTQKSHHEVDSSAWLGFLRLLKKYRPRRPINGVILTVSIQDLLVQSEQERILQARALKERIDELNRTLEIRMPIYVLFTKGDLIAGFSDFFSNIPPTESEQVWGISWPERERGANNSGPSSALDLGYFSTGFKNLVQRLNQRVIKLMQQQRDIARCASVQSFPSQFALLEGVIDQFLNQVFAVNRYQVQADLRGVYFTSALQEGTPINRLMSVAAASFGFDREVAQNQSASSRSFFLRHLFREIIIPEADRVGTNHRLERLILWGRRASMAACVSLLVACVTVWFYSIDRHRDLLNEVTQGVVQFEKERQQMIDSEPSETSDPYLSVAALNSLTDVKRHYEQKPYQWATRLGLVSSNSKEELERLYAQSLEVLFLPRLMGALEHILTDKQTDLGELLSALRIYLMLGHQEHRDHALIQEWWQNYWLEQFPHYANRQEKLQNHLSALLSDQALSATLSDQVIADTRQRLENTPVVERLYAQLQQQDAAREHLEVNQLGGSDLGSVFHFKSGHHSLSIPKMFTKVGYQEIDLSVQSPLLKSLDRDRWVFGDAEKRDASSSEFMQVGEEIESLYLRDYANRWSGLLAGLQVQPFNSLSHAVQQINRMIDSNRSPLLAVLRSTANNTELTPRHGDALDRLSPTSKSGRVRLAAVKSTYQPNHVDLSFAEINRLTSTTDGQPMAIQPTLEVLQKLRSYLNAMALAGDGGQSAFNAAKARFKGDVTNDPLRALRLEADQLPEPVRGWMFAVADESWKLILSESKQYVDRVWQEEVYSYYRQHIKGRYPVQKQSSGEVALFEFSDYFKPAGVVDSFVADYLAPFVDTRKWRVKKLEGRGLTVSQDTLKQLSNAARIRRAFFKQNAESPVIDFKLKPLKLDAHSRKFELALGSQTVAYTHGPRISNTLSWPSSSSDRIRVQFQDLNNATKQKYFDGDWALFRALDMGSLRRTSRANVFKVTFREAGHQADYELQASSVENPFSSQLSLSYFSSEIL